MDHRRDHDEHRRHHDHDDRRHKRFEEEFRFHRDDFDRDRMRKRVHVMKHPKRPFGKTITKLITSKEDLVQYVNDLGEKGHKIDVYKIEDDLYKVVVKQMGFNPFDIEDEVDIEIEKD